MDIVEIKEKEKEKEIQWIENTKSGCQIGYAKHRWTKFVQLFAFALKGESIALFGCVDPNNFTCTINIAYKS